ncbi:MAG: hypothetical protein RL189_3075 [Pseudomonadota bacterium]|jgi:excisionase family DNA binding protein
MQNPPQFGFVIHFFLCSQIEPLDCGIVLENKLSQLKRRLARMLSQISLASGTHSGQRPRNGHDRIFEKQTGFALTKSDFVDEWLTSDEAAAFLKISTATLRNLTSSGKIPFYKFGRRNRYSKRELKNMLLSNRKGV